MSDLSGVVNEQKATIEALRRRVAELEEKIEHYDTAEYHLSQMVKSLTAENAELKRQVEALREATSDLVDNLQAVVNVCRQEPAMNHHRYDSLGVSALKAVDHGRTALREAAKGEVE